MYRHFHTKILLYNIKKTTYVLGPEVAVLKRELKKKTPPKKSNSLPPQKKIKMSQLSGQLFFEPKKNCRASGFFLGFWWGSAAS